MPPSSRSSKKIRAQFWFDFLVHRSVRLAHAMAAFKTFSRFILQIIATLNEATTQHAKIGFYFRRNLYWYLFVVFAVNPTATGRLRLLAWLRPSGQCRLRILFSKKARGILGNPLDILPPQTRSRGDERRWRPS